jgi:hypothetical protein
VALGLIAALAGIGITAAATAWRAPILPFFEACCVIPLGVVVVLELSPAIITLWGSRGTAARQRAICRFRHQLDALPETHHPFDG